MKMLLDFLPVLLFFIAYRGYNIYVATGVLMFATVVQMGYLYYRQRRLDAVQKFTLVLVLGFGALTVILQNETFIKFKPTVLYAGMAVALAVALWVFNRNVLSALLGAQISLPPQKWRTIAIAWIVYCAFMAVLNALVAQFYSTDAWVNFKLWGFIFPAVFLLGQALYIVRHSEQTGRQ